MLNSQRVNILIYGPSSISCKPRFFATLSISESWRISPERPGSILADWRCSGTSKNADLAGFSTAWWLTYPSEKYQFVSWDYEIPNIYIYIMENKNMFQTSNQSMNFYRRNIFRKLDSAEFSLIRCPCLWLVAGVMLFFPWWFWSSQVAKNYIPSGKHTNNYGKSQFLMGKLTINGHFQ